MNDADDLMALLGVVLPPPILPKAVGCGEKAPRAKQVRHTEWSNAHSFEFGGYLAKVIRTQCEMCERASETLVGVFTEEIHQPSGTRRLTLMGKGAQWPVGVEHRLEITDATTLVCAECVRDLGFSREVDSKGEPYTMFVRG